MAETFQETSLQDDGDILDKPKTNGQKLKAINPLV